MDKANIRDLVGHKEWDTLSNDGKQFVFCIVAITIINDVCNKLIKGIEVKKND